MAPRRRTDPVAGQAAVGQWLAARGAGEQVPRAVAATAVRYTLEELGARAPGGSVEVRVPPFGVVQCIEGTTHRRGTPPAVVEMAPEVWLELATGQCAWADAVGGGAVQASGQRAELTAHLPLVASSGP
ncbi:hypothetical protein SAMN05445756_2203 [Kytococcus aerolatus]|uniref:Bacterial SCP orthologue domain-containing protein n=1 Tax=Kytococcus aerolatus TaxID=592308 RepID=A0A212U7P9_9MICO|nr:sterol carrier family protein [Kytococcus aerolatus]SNC74285.1 hypothetical protein SAMN05445756_2203 [Kytococcus aerolatus]